MKALIPIQAPPEAPSAPPAPVPLAPALQTQAPTAPQAQSTHVDTHEKHKIIFIGTFERKTV